MSRKSETSSLFLIIDLILAIAVYFPVWPSHCTRARFTVLVSCSDELAVHSCSLIYLQTAEADCETCEQIVLLLVFIV